jgi:regulation of enolase protein 1 (concanavalin A-like superfamily)
VCCTPERGGLNVEFSSFTVAEPLQKDLHDLS